jgi:hypothetical protein
LDTDKSKAAENDQVVPEGKEQLSAPSQRRGRPSKLQADVQTLRKIEGCARVNASMEEMATVLGVNRKTLSSFMKKNPEAREAFKRNYVNAKISLRRAQFRLALQGNVKMAIHLGKKYLGQHD